MTIAGMYLDHDADPEKTAVITVNVVRKRGTVRKPAKVAYRADVTFFFEELGRATVTLKAVHESEVAAKIHAKLILQEIREQGLNNWLEQDKNSA